MRMMLKAVVETDAGNEAIRSGSLAKVVEVAMRQLDPEAAYFFAEDGRRASVMVFDMVDASQIPQTLEPLFLGVKAQVTLTPCMNLDDLQKGLSQLPPDVAST